MIAAIAHANDAAVVTHNVKDFAGLEGLVEVIPA
jgi:predicted nucleic acid-binding protein